jgi:hypothetical protein
MKKVLGILAVLLLALQMMIPLASADEPAEPQGRIGGVMFYDADRDGIKSEILEIAYPIVRYAHFAASCGVLRQFLTDLC